MREYGPLLKKLISFSGMKMSTVANLLSYDLSYISKWCNQSKLPAARIAPELNRTLSLEFSREIRARGDEERFRKYFSVSGEELEDGIFRLLNEAYKESEGKGSGGYSAERAAPATILTQASDIYAFFHTELIELVRGMEEPAEILCTLDLGSFLDTAGSEPLMAHNSASDIRVKIGMDKNAFNSEKGRDLKALYSFLNVYHRVAFDIYDNSLMDNMNTIVVKGKLAILCALDQYNRITTAAVVQDMEKVNQIYLKLLPVFRSSPVLLHHAKAAEFNKGGYRTDFYARENYQILTVRGFEFLLPVECWGPIIQTAMEKQFEKMASEGWLIDKISAYFWTYRRVDPTNLHITVTYFPNASEFDPGPKQRLTRAGASKGTNYTLTILLIIVMTLVFLGILTAYILRNGVDDGRTPVDSYEKNGWTFEIYDEPMPLYVEDLMEIGDSTWSRERNKHNETLLLSRSEYRQDHVKGGPEGLKDLAYTVITYKGEAC